MLLARDLLEALPRGDAFTDRLLQLGRHVVRLRAAIAAVADVRIRSVPLARIRPARTRRRPARPVRRRERSEEDLRCELLELTKHRANIPGRCHRPGRYRDAKPARKEMRASRHEPDQCSARKPASTPSNSQRRVASDFASHVEVARPLAPSDSNPGSERFGIRRESRRAEPWETTSTRRLRERA